MAVKGKKRQRFAGPEWYQKAMVAEMERRKRRRAAYYVKHPEARRKLVHRTHLQQKYGLSFENYKRLYRIQKGRCAICQRPFAKLHVDHCHQTQRVRGLLCNACNTGLGFLREDVLVLRAMITYVEDRCVLARLKGPIDSPSTS